MASRFQTFEQGLAQDQRQEGTEYMAANRLVALVEDRSRIEQRLAVSRNSDSTCQSGLYLSATSSADSSVLVRNTHFPSKRASDWSLSKS
ncbi:MAG: hypothetical protein L0Y39_01275 [Methylococcaceae bacterium]|nr:hypothetical protein [Methylococcaceae bacterium]